MHSLAGACAPALPHISLSCTSCSLLSYKKTPPLTTKVLFKCSETNVHLPFPPARRRNNGLEIAQFSGGRARGNINDNELDTSSSNLTTTTQDLEKDALAAKLAAAEAEAEALKKELAVRRAGSRDGDLSKLKIATPQKRIDGTGYREQLFSGPGAKKAPEKWGITEGELFLSKGAPTEGRGLGVPAIEEGADAIISKRLLIGLGLTAVALALAFIKLPVILTKPSKPLFFYITYILRLKDQLDKLENTASDAKDAETVLKMTLGSEKELKDNFLSAAALLEGDNVDKASQLAFEVFGYLDQADYSKYFENLGEPSSSQKLEFLKFSLQSMRAANQKIQKFLILVPAEPLAAAKLRMTR